MKQMFLTIVLYVQLFGSKTVCLRGSSEIIEGKTGDCQDAILKLNDLASKLHQASV